MDEREAEIAVAALQEQLDDLARVEERFVESPDASRLANRFDRWKVRAVEPIQRHVSPREADKFQNTYVPVVWGMGEANYTLEAIARHKAAIETLMEELSEHPEAVPYGALPEDRGGSEVEDSPILKAMDEEVDPRIVFVIHGRDREAKDAIFSFLRSLDLHPLDWEELVQDTGKASPYNAEVVTRAFRLARAVVALFTPDDEARLNPELQGDGEPEHERNLTGQARPNVFIEAGMALQAHPDRTILVEIGQLRPASDLSGMNAVRLGGGPGPLWALVQRLETAGCAVNRTSEDWMDAERFRSLAASRRRPAGATSQASEALPRGQRLSGDRPQPGPPELKARLHQRGKGHLLEVTNRGGVAIKNVRWDLPPEAGNWHVLTQALPEYPIDEIRPRDHVRLPVSISMGGPVMIDLELIGELEDGTPYQSQSRLSVYD